MVQTMKKGDRVIIGDINEGLHPTDPSIHVCSLMRNMRGKAFTVDIASDKERVFKVEGEPHFFSYDHAGMIVEDKNANL